MKYKFLNITLVLLSLNIIGQAPINLNKLFYNLPIDSCISYIKTKAIDKDLFKVKPSKVLEYKINMSKVLTNQNIDSVTMKIICEGLGVGGSPNQVSPIEYEQWLINTYYFKSDSAANNFFKNQKIQLDSFDKDPYLKENDEEIEWTYSFEVIDIKRIRYRQVHLNFEKNSRKVNNSYRLIFDNNPCNCD